MAEELQFRGSRVEDLQEILSFIEKNDFTKRSAESWEGEKMEAALATQGGKIVGAFPFAVRRLKVGRGAYANAGHASAVAIEESLRGKGIGSKMVSFFKQGGFPGLDLLIVNRIDKCGEDKAYRWYRKNGFRDMASVKCLFASPEKIVETCGKRGKESRAVVARIDEKSIGSIDFAGLRGLFEESFGKMGGFQERSPEFWKNRFRHHYYREKNEYWLVELFGRGGLEAYAIIGKNSIHNETKANVLEYAIGGKTACGIKGLVAEIARFCTEKGIPLVRFVISDCAKAYGQLLELGFEERDCFKIMALELKQGILEKKADWVFFDFDYI